MHDELLENKWWVGKGEVRKGEKQGKQGDEEKMIKERLTRAERRGGEMSRKE